MESEHAYFMYRVILVEAELERDRGLWVGGCPKFLINTHKEWILPFSRARVHTCTFFAHNTGFALKMEIVPAVHGTRFFF